MTKTPDDVKKGLECCSQGYCNDCPYLPLYNSFRCKIERTKDALALIQQLQDDNAELNRCIENMTDKLNAMNDEVAKLQAERDAAVGALKNGDVCEACKHFGTLMDEEPCASCSILHSNFEWRGVQKEE